MKDIRIANHIIGPKHDVFIIAEAGINHNGSYTLAKKLVDAAKKAGADCIKFQTHITEKEMIRSDVKPRERSKKTLWDIIKSCEITEKEEEQIKNYCKQHKILFLSTPFSKEGVDRLEKLKTSAYKIGSGELTNLPFLNHIAQTKKPVILSTGMSTMKEIREAVNLFKNHKVPLALLQTTSSYPSSYSDINLGVIEKYEKIFNVPVGISDHSPGIYIPLGAVAKGACIVEKHFTLNKNMAGPDQKLSLEPTEFQQLIMGCRAVKAALGTTKKILKSEKPILKFARESVVAIRSIVKGEKFSEENISTKRPGTGPIPANQFYKVLGKKSCRNILFDQQLSWNDIA